MKREKTQTAFFAHQKCVASILYNPPTTVHTVTHMFLKGAEGKWEVRGCCFKHTAHNEQHMCDVIASVLEKEGMVVGNRSLCLWHYSIPGEPVDVVSSNNNVGEKGLYMGQ